MHCSGVPTIERARAVRKVSVVVKAFQGLTPKSPLNSPVQIFSTRHAIKEKRVQLALGKQIFAMLEISCVD